MAARQRVTISSVSGTQSKEGDFKICLNIAKPWGGSTINYKRHNNEMYTTCFSVCILVLFCPFVY